MNTGRKLCDQSFPDYTYTQRNVLAGIQVSMKNEAWRSFFTCVGKGLRVFFFARLNSPDLHVCLTCRSALSLVSIFCHLLTLWAFRDWLLCLLCTLWYYKSLTDYSDSDGRFYLKSILQWCNRYIIHYKMGFNVYIFTFLQCNKKTKLTLSPTKYLFIYILA